MNEFIEVKSIEVAETIDDTSLLLNRLAVNATFIGSALIGIWSSLCVISAFGANGVIPVILGLFGAIV